MVCATSRMCCLYFFWRENMNIHIDIETYSSADLSKSGVYRYTEAPDFEILLFAYSIDAQEVNVVDLASGEKIPNEILQALRDPLITKWAFNAHFERICLSRYLGMSTGTYLDPSSWRCSMIHSAYLGLPLSLKGVGVVLGLEKQKLEEGKDLIRYFCVPCKPTKVNGGRTRNLPTHASEKWKLFKEYNIRDVEVELQIQKRLRNYPVPDDIWDEYHLDQEINDRGIKVDLTLVKNAQAIDSATSEKLLVALRTLTNLENPNSVMQMKGWLKEAGLSVESLGKKNVKTLLKDAQDEIKEVLALRLKLSKSSIKKYKAMENAVNSDCRLRGCFQFYGANRTGRFSGRLVQLQNLTRNDMPDLDEARAIVRNGDIETLELLYDDTPDVLSQLIRTAFIPSQGKRFFVADFSAIEARVSAWLAGETWKSEAFNNNEDIYCKTASKMFKVPVVKHGINGELRQKGKIAELACIAKGQLVLTDRGPVPIEDVTREDKIYDGEEYVSHEGVMYRGCKEVIEYDGLWATEDHLVYCPYKKEPIELSYAKRTRLPLTMIYYEIPHKPYKKYAEVYDIYNAGPRHRYTVQGKLVHNCSYGGSVGALISMGAEGVEESELKELVLAWRNANPNIVKLWWDVDKAIKKVIKTGIEQEVRGVYFSYKSSMLFITLPSGRKLSYVKPFIDQNRFGGESVSYEGVGENKHWERIESYGPKFVENIVQAISRDLLMDSMMRLKDMSIVAHVHDELIIEADANESLQRICEQMSIVPHWAEGLVLRADGYVCDFYKKD